MKQKDIKKMIPFRNPFNHPSICFKLSSIKSLDGGYRDIPYYEDYDLWIRLSDICMMTHIPEPLSFVRETGNNQSMKMTAEIFEQNVRTISQRNV